jgi:hypothetical protein
VSLTSRTNKKKNPLRSSFLLSSLSEQKNKERDRHSLVSIFSTKALPIHAQKKKKSKS